MLQKMRQSAQSGQGLVEYVLIILLVALVTVGAFTLLGGTLNSTFTTIAGKI